MIGSKTSRLLVSLVLLQTLASSASPIPSKLGPLRLVKLLEGPEAQRAVNELHGKEIPVTQAYVAHYAGLLGKRWARATLWAARAQDVEQAKELFSRMVQGLKSGSGTFGHYHTIRLDSRVLHVVFGQGQVHYVYRNRPWILWLALDPHLPKTVLQDALKVGEDSGP